MDDNFPAQHFDLVMHTLEDGTKVQRIQLLKTKARYYQHSDMSRNEAKRQLDCGAQIEQNALLAPGLEILRVYEGPPMPVERNLHL